MGEFEADLGKKFFARGFSLRGTVAGGDPRPESRGLGEDMVADSAGSDSEVTGGGEEVGAGEEEARGDKVETGGSWRELTADDAREDDATRLAVLAVTGTG